MKPLHILALLVALCLLLLLSCKCTTYKDYVINYRVALVYNDDTRDTVEGRFERPQSNPEWFKIDMFSLGRKEPCVCISYISGCDYMIASGVRSYDVLFLSKEILK